MEKQYSIVTTSCRTEPASKSKPVDASSKWNSYSTRQIDVRLSTGDIYRCNKLVEEISYSDRKINALVDEMTNDDIHLRSPDEMDSDPDWCIRHSDENV